MLVVASCLWLFDDVCSLFVVRCLLLFVGCLMLVVLWCELLLGLGC